MNNDIRSMVLSFGADVCGIAAAKDLSNAPEGFRPTDIFEKCKSRIIRVRFFIFCGEILMKKVVISLISFVAGILTTGILFLIQGRTN
ncbi:hypothetical protein [Syntrophomonas curvata]